MLPTCNSRFHPHWIQHYKSCFYVLLLLKIVRSVFLNQFYNFCLFYVCTLGMSINIVWILKCYAKGNGIFQVFIVQLK